MTYCVALRLRDGLVMLADTRTNAGVDHISTFSKTYIFEAGGERAICLLSAGNLALTQAIVNRLTEGFQTGEGEQQSLYTVKSMFQAAQLVGTAVREVGRADGDALRAQGVPFDVSLLLGGQLRGGRVRLFQIYAAGNFIEATEDTPYLQIGEHKYGKPILDRACRYDTDLHDGVKLVLISMDSTLRSNLTVGLPIDLFVYRKDALKAELLRRIGEDDPYFQMISRRWSEALREAYRAIPRPDWN
jgi:putative proteasome-type protease